MNRVSEEELYGGYGLDDTVIPWERAALTEDELLLASGYEFHQCPGDGRRGCGVTIPLDRVRCHFCKKTIRLRQEPPVIP